MKKTIYQNDLEFLTVKHVGKGWVYIIIDEPYEGRMTAMIDEKEVAKLIEALQGVIESESE